MTSSNNVPGKHQNPASNSYLLDDSNLSSMSVLNELGASAVLDTSADLQLRFQRLLAESALETSAAFDDCSIASLSKSTYGLPNSQISGTSTPWLNSTSCSDVFSEVNLHKNEEYETLFKKYYSEDFIPAEKALDKLKADEIAWKEEYCLPPAQNKKSEQSHFSGIIGEAELSVQSSVGTFETKNKFSAEEYFGLKTDQIGSFSKGLTNGERPNFGHEILSPNVGRPHIAFVEDPVKEGPVTIDTQSNDADIDASHNSTAKSSNEEAAGLNSTMEDKSSCTMSVTSIEDILSKHLLDTPGTIARSILNPKGKVKTPGSESVSFGQMSATSDNTIKNDTDSTITDWVSLEMSNAEYEAYVGSSFNASLVIQSQSTRWLKCYMSVHKVICNKIHDVNVEKEISANIKFPEVILIGPGQKVGQAVNITPALPGNLEIYIAVDSEDAVTQRSMRCIAKFEICSKIPKVEIYWKGIASNEVDFGTLPEGCSQLTKLEIRNYSEMKLPMTIGLEEISSTHAFFLHKGDKEDNETSVQSRPEEVEKYLKIGVAFKAPSIKAKEDTDNGLVYYSAYLNVSIDIPEVKSCLLKKLKLKGCVGITQLLMNFTSPVELLSSGPGIPNSKTLSLKNSGVVPLKLKLLILDPLSWQIETNGVIVINSPTLNILPGKEALFTLMFTPTWVFEELFERKLVIHVTPDGNLFEIDVHAKIAATNGRGSDQERLSSHSLQSIGSAGTSTTSRSVGGMPVQTTHKQLIWNTVPVGKSVKQSCRLRNDWPTSVKVLLNLVDSSHGFWLVNENGEHVVERKIKLHAKECIPIYVVFYPSKIGTAYGKILISEARRGSCAERFAIPLFGYAGTFNLNIRNVPKDKSGHMWINLGPLDSRLQTHFSILNKGNLDAFVFMNYYPKGIGTLLQGSSVKINPSKIVIAPGSHENITIDFCLQSDVSFIAKDNRDVLELGVLYLTCGDEPSRQRIRRIFAKQTEATARNKLLDLESLCSSFPGETSISDLGTLSDPESAIRSLYRTFLQHEIAVTVDKTDDRSMAMQTCIGNGHFANDSLTFKSILPDYTLCPSVEESSPKDVSSWSIIPSSLTLLMPQFASGCITISSTCDEDQTFRVTSSDEFLSVEPSSGIIPGHGEVVAVVMCDARATKTSLSVKSSLKVYLENDMKEVTILIKCTSETLTPITKLSNKEPGTDGKISRCGKFDKKNGAYSNASKPQLLSADSRMIKDSKRKIIHDEAVPAFNLRDKN